MMERDAAGTIVRVGTMPDTGNLGRSMAQAVWPFPQLTEHSGCYVDLVPLEVEHTDLLWPDVSAAAESFIYLRYGPFSRPDELRLLLADLSSRRDQPFWLVSPRAGAGRGWLSLCDIYQRDGSIEVGSIWFSPALQQTRAAREAVFLLMRHAMDDLGYERLVWRCQANNAKSFKAAESLGFTHEGTWRRAAVFDGWQRDIAWFSILQEEWPQRRQALLRWLAPDNFDEAGQQIRGLAHFVDPTGPKA